jgi:hypothetical protein
MSKCRTPRNIPTPAVSLHEIGVRQWEYDLWYRIVEAVIDGHPNQVWLTDLQGFDKPAISRYAATTPVLLRWFKKHNKNRSYREQVRPFGFLCALQGARDLQMLEQLDALAAEPRRWTKLRKARMHSPRVVSPFDPDPEVAGTRAFDRDTGDPVPVEQLLTYHQVLAQYHLHPDPKFHGTDYGDCGPTDRRHIEAIGFEYIGKEANRWEEQFYLGEDPEAQVLYGSSDEDRDRQLEVLSEAAKRYGQRALARVTKQPREKLAGVLKGMRPVGSREASRMTASVEQLDENDRQQREREAELIEDVRKRCEAVGLREFARQAHVDPSNLAKVLEGKRSRSNWIISRLRSASLGSDDSRQS